MIILAKKENKFDLDEELKLYPKPEFFKRAFLKTVDTTDIKSKSDLDKALKKFEEMK